MTQVTEIERRGDIAILRFNRPEARNALSVALAEAIIVDLIALAAAPGVSAIVLTGAGDRAFCAGADIREARAVQVDQVATWFGTLCSVYRQILLTNKPVVAALNGTATGAGFQIALVADQRVAHPDVRLGQPEINVGIPSIMGSYWMSFHLSLSKNQELSFTGDLVDAAEAERLGLINRMAEAGELLDVACDLAATLAAKPPTAWAHTKARFREQALAGFDDAFRAAVEGQRECFANGEPQAVIDQFFAKPKS